MTYSQIMKNLNTTVYAAIRAGIKEDLDTRDLREVAAKIDQIIDRGPIKLEDVIFSEKES